MVWDDPRPEEMADPEIEQRELELADKEQKEERKRLESKHFLLGDDEEDEEDKEDGNDEENGSITPVINKEMKKGKEMKKKNRLSVLGLHGLEDQKEVAGKVIPLLWLSLFCYSLPLELL